MVVVGSVVAFDVVFGAFVAAFVVLTVLTVRCVFRRNPAGMARYRRARASEDDGSGEGGVPGSERGVGPTGDAGGEDEEEDEPEPPVIALVLAGGGNKGAVQVGMLEVLAEHGFVPDMIFGSSVGAVNGGAYAGDPTRRGAERLTEVWRGLTGEDVFPEGRLHGPWRWLRQRPAVHGNDGLRRIIEAGLTFDRLEDAPIPFEVVATSLTDGQAHWFTSGPAAEAVLASAAIPAILPPVVIDGEAYIDGGVVDNVPIWRAVDAGATVILVLLCGPPVYSPPVAKRPVEAMVNALFVSIHARFAVDASRLPEGVEVVLCTGDASVVHDYADFSHTEALMNVGRAEAAEVLRRHWEILGLDRPPTVHPIGGADAPGTGGRSELAGTEGTGSGSGGPSSGYPGGSEPVTGVTEVVAAGGASDVSEPADPAGSDGGPRGGADDGGRRDGDPAGGGRRGERGSVPHRSVPDPREAPGAPLPTEGTRPGVREQDDPTQRSGARQVTSRRLARTLVSRRSR